MTCARTRTDPIIPVKEKGKTFTINNPNRLTVIEVKVDGCLIKGGQPKCDYLFEVPEPQKRVCYVELKGRKLEEAKKQLIATMEHTKANYKNHQKECYVVASNIHAPLVTSIQHELKRDYGASFKAKTNQMSINIP